MSTSQKLKSYLDKGVVSYPTTIAAAIGIIMASPVILTVTTGFGIGGNAFALAVLIAFIMMQAQLTTFSEASSMLPTSGSVYDYISCGMGRFFAIIGAISAYIIVHVFAGTAETILSGIMALVNFDQLNTIFEANNSSWMIGVGLLVIFGFLNAFGIEVFGKVEVVLTFCIWTTLMIFSIYGLILPAAVPSESWFGTAINFGNPSEILSLIGLAMFMFVGCELVTPLAPDIKNSSKVIPRSMMFGLSCVALCMCLYGAAMTHQVHNIVVDEATQTRLLETPMAIPVFADRLMGTFGKYWIGVSLLLAGAATINSLIAAVSRILYGMALDGALPKIFTYLHPRFKTPVVGILVAVLIPVIHSIIIQGDLDKILPLVGAAICAWGVAYLLVTISIVILRIRRPDYPRFYRAPFYPIPQIISSVGIIIAILYIAPPGVDPNSIYIPFVIILAVTAIYALFWTLIIQRINPFKPVALEDALNKEFGKYDKEIGDQLHTLSSKE